MSTVQIHKLNEATLRIVSEDSGALRELWEHFTFEVEGARFMPMVRQKLWDGKVHLLDGRTGTLPYGLLLNALTFLRKLDYKIELDRDIIEAAPENKEHLYEFAKSLDIRSKGETIIPRDYQLEAFAHGINEGRSLIISPTGSGKSLIIYMAIRWYLENHDDRVMIVVPTTSLVEQLKKDFADYSSHDSEFDPEHEVHQIYSGKEKDPGRARIVITTWQSAVKQPRDWFLQYGMIIGDEAHLFKAKSLNTIMEQLVNASYRIGTTGTLDGSTCNELVLIGNFGPVHRVISTKELIDNETLANLEIKCLLLKHTDELKKAVCKMNYQGEISTIVEHPGRNRLITNLACDQTGNTLVLFNLVNKHGKPLYNMIKEKAGDNRHIFYVSGEVAATDRETIREITEGEKDAIIVASVGTFSTGINIKNLHNIIFAAPTKSQIRVLQSIGRGLRQSDDGRHTTVYDLADDFSWRKKKNYTLKHALSRIDIYLKESFDYKIFEIPLPL